MRRTPFPWVSGLVGVAATLAIASCAEAAQEICTSKFKGRRPTAQEIRTVLSENQMNSLLGGKILMPGPNFCEANLSNADLTGAGLVFGNLAHANLQFANLADAMLDHANLRGANLWWARLDRANFTGADLAGAAFNLSTRYNPDQSKYRLPGFEGWGGVQGLSKMRLSSDASTLSTFQSLREELKKAGLREEERGLTASIQRAQMRNANLFERSLKLLAFDLPCDYGAEPGRPLWLMVGVAGTLWPFYTHTRVQSRFRRSSRACLKQIRRRGGIWRIWGTDRLLDVRRAAAGKGVERLSHLSLPKALGYGLYFSLLSAFHIGWRDLNVGNWIARMQPREYTLRPQRMGSLRVGASIAPQCVSAGVECADVLWKAVRVTTRRLTSPSMAPVRLEVPNGTLRASAYIGHRLGHRYRRQPYVHNKATVKPVTKLRILKPTSSDRRNSGEKMRESASCACAIT
jgi:uncharacterized protein YjbI with pentapeptide repeats